MAISSVDNAVVQLAKNPANTQDYLDKNPDKVDKFVSKAVDHYYDSLNKDESEADSYANLLSIVGINMKDFDEIDNITSLKTKAEQDDLEKTPEFAKEMDFVKGIADEYDKEKEKTKTACSVEKVEKIFSLTPANFKKYTDEEGIPYINDGNVTFYNVDQYSKLKAKQGYLERDHIPSYKALELFFIRNNKTTVEFFHNKRNILSI